MGRVVNRVGCSIVLLIYLAAVACTNEVRVPQGEQGGERVQFSFRMITRQGNAEFEERSIDDVFVFVFVGELLADIHHTATAEQNRILFDLLATSRPTEVHFLANAGLSLEQLKYLKGTHLKDFKFALPHLIPAARYARLPMWGHLSFPNGIKALEPGETSRQAVQMLRTVAKVVIEKAEHIPDELFNLNSIRVYRANKGVVIPDAEAMNPDDFRVDRATLPIVHEEAEQITSQPPILIDEPKFPQILYLNECEGMDSADLNWSNQLTTIVVGGFYNGSSRETFYRIDSRRIEKGDVSRVVVGELLRNHYYSFLINKVTGPGCDTPITAANFIDCGTSIEVVGWIPKEWDFPTLGETFFGAYSIVDWVIAQSSLMLGVMGSQALPWIPKDLLEELGNSGSQTVPWFPNVGDQDLGGTGFPTTPWVPKESDEDLGEDAINMVIPWHRFDWAGFYGDGKFDIVEPWKHLTNIRHGDMGQEVDDSELDGEQKENKENE